VDLPNAQNRKKILHIFLSKENLDQNFNYEELANATEGYSGSDLKVLFNSSKLIASVFLFAGY
jgi:ATP-dependent 26S proteasome regulatory subunit